MKAPFAVTSVETQVHLESVRGLFEAYATSLHLDLSFQRFEQEVANLPGEYSPPTGLLLLAECGEDPSGCVALRRWEPGICEMKRLYVPPKFRGYGIGNTLCEAIIAGARAIGYHKMRLDTLPSMDSAQALYMRLGFKDVEAYRFNPVPGVRFLELDLAAVAISKVWEFVYRQSECELR